MDANSGLTHSMFHDNGSMIHHYASHLTLLDVNWDQNDIASLSWVSEPSLFAALVFVVWRTVDSKQKGRVVIDIRNLNDVNIPDVYLLPC